MSLLKKPWFLIIMISLVVSLGILVAGGVDLGVDFLPEDREDNEEDIMGDEVVMIANGIEFKYSEFKGMMEQMQWELLMEGKEATPEAVKEATINRLIQQAVLIEYARQEGLTPTQEDIDARLLEIAESYQMTPEDFLRKVKTEDGIDEDEVNEILKSEVMVQRLFDIYIEKVVVDDSEVAERIKEMEIDESELSPEDIEEMNSFIRESIKYEKATEDLLEKVETLKESAVVELFLDDLNL